MLNKSINPEDILADGIDSTIINGTTVRKGSIAAFLANIKLLENNDLSDQEKEQVITTMKELASAVIAIGLHQQVVFKNALAEKILADAELALR